MNWKCSPKCSRISACHWRTSPFGDDENSARHPAELELAQDETSFDRLAESNFVSQQIADPVPAHRTV